ncbi:hypothetical protein [Microcoleus sp. B4-D4]|uniref:hypothetical protein n=1 Tax=Microcoleus sp. B4-D4 TaxID=2818667 RepID=UPI002FD41BD8
MKPSYLSSGICPNSCSSAIGKNITHQNQIPTVFKGEQPVCAIAHSYLSAIANQSASTAT